MGVQFILQRLELSLLGSCLQYLQTLIRKRQYLGPAHNCLRDLITVKICRSPPAQGGSVRPIAHSYAAFGVLRSLLEQSWLMWISQRLIHIWEERVYPEAVVERFPRGYTPSWMDEINYLHCQLQPRRWLTALVFTTNESSIHSLGYSVEFDSGIEAVGTQQAMCCIL